MNPSGYRIEEKKETEHYHQHHHPNSQQQQPKQQHHSNQYSEEKSVHSYKSTHSSRSSVLERAREYNRRIDQQNNNRRAKSLERSSNAGSGYSQSESTTDRSRSLGRSPQSGGGGGNSISTHERAMASVRKDSATKTHNNNNNNPTTPALARRLKSNQMLQQQHAGHGGNNPDQPHPTTPASTNISRNTNTTASTRTPGGAPRNGMAAPQQQQQQQQPQATITPRRTTVGNIASGGRGPNPNTNNSASRMANAQRIQANNNRGQQQHQPPNNPKAFSQQHAPQHPSGAERGGRGEDAGIEGEEGDGGGNPNAVVTPELLVDALSGHEDGLLAIAEKLMEHYDSGYDVMGEAIIDAFADVQKLFQHVVEAAHMEGAAFEASRREAELAELRKQQEAAGLPMLDDLLLGGGGAEGAAGGDAAGPAVAASPAGAAGRHDEFVDQDVKDVLTEAIRKGTAMQRDSSGNTNHDEIYRLYEQACQSASALLPVDSDHRGRLQLSIARAESMGPDRACAILRYAMDDVLRSGMRAGRTPLPDPSKRADVVLSRPTPSSAAGSAAGSHGGAGGAGSTSMAAGSNLYKVAQSSDEALASLMEEMKEIMNAPVYSDTPLQAVAIRFWTALTESQKSQQKNEERLEQALAKLKGDFLLARAEWEEKLNKCNEKADLLREKYEKLKQQSSLSSSRHRRGNSNSSNHALTEGDDIMEKARSNYRNGMSGDDTGRRQPSSHSGGAGSSGSGVAGVLRGGFPGSAAGSRTGSVASLGSGIAVHAKKLVNSIHDFNCNGDRAADQQIRSELQDMAKHDHAHRSIGATKSPHRNKHHHHQTTSAQGTPSSRSVRSHNTNASSSSIGQHYQNQNGPSSRSFREYSKSPKRMDV